MYYYLIKPEKDRNKYGRSKGRSEKKFFFDIKN
jgi:hypothetical protein